MLGICGGMVGCYGGLQVATAVSGGLCTRVLLSGLPVLIPGVAAAVQPTAPLMALSLAKSLASVAVANPVRDVLNAAFRRVGGDIRAVDERGVPLHAGQSLQERGAVSASAPIPLNAGVAAAGHFLAPELARMIGSDAIGDAIAHALVRGAYTVPLEGGRKAAGPIGYLEGEGLAAVGKNLEDWRAIKATLAHASMHTSVRSLASAVSTQLPDLVADLLPENSTAQMGVYGVKWLLQGAGELRGQVVERYEAALACQDHSQESANAEDVAEAGEVTV
jgi:hypothetical protein